MTTRTAKYSYRAIPTQEQAQWLSSAFGAVRVVYNNYLWQKEQVYCGKLTTVNRLDRFSTLPTDYNWLRDHSQKILEQSRRQAETAYKNFFDGLAGRRANRVGKPTFKKKRAGGSLSWNGASLQTKKLSNDWMAVRLPKGPKNEEWLKFRLSRELPTKPTGVTLKRSPTGDYTVSFTVQQQIAEPKTTGTAAGVDLGLTDLVTVVKTDGSRYKVASPKNYRRAERKLAHLQQNLSRKASGSQNREKARLAVAKQHGRTAAQRLDLARKIAFRLADENQAVSLETLNLKGLVKNKKLSKSFHDAGLGQLVQLIESAAQRLGTEVLRVDRWAPTSQACSVCGVIDGPKDLSVRVWECGACGALLDRDYNAAVNVLALAVGHTDSLNGSRERIRPSLEQLAAPDEAMLNEGATPRYKAHRPSKRRSRKVSLARRAKLTTTF